MRTIGTEEAGFSVALNTSENLIRVVGWGFWEADVADAFDDVVIEVCLYAPMGTELSLDMSRLRPMRDEGQKAFRNTITALKQSKISKITVTTSSQLTKLQLMRIAREAAPPERVHFC